MTDIEVGFFKGPFLTRNANLIWNYLNAKPWFTAVDAGFISAALQSLETSQELHYPATGHTINYTEANHAELQRPDEA